VALGLRRAAIDGHAPASVAAFPRRPRLRHLPLALLAATTGAQDAEYYTAASLLELYDADGDGVVNHAEYMRAAMDAVEDHGITDRELRATLLGYHTQLFSQGDIDDSGNLCERELEYVAHLAQEASKPPKGGSEADEDEDEFGVRASWEVLQALDTSGDEMVDWAEFQEAIAQHRPSNGDDAHFDMWSESVFHRADVVADGALDARELQYAGFLLRFAAADVRETSAFLEFLFQEFDTDGDGWIRAREMKRAAGRVRDDETRDIAAQVRAVEDSVFSAQVHLHFAEADANSDGRLDRQEAQELVELIRDMDVHDV